MTVTFLDPFSVSPLVLSLSSAQWLVDTRRLAPEPQGLFGFLKPQPGASSAVPEELAQQGFSPSASTRSRETDALLAALEVVGRPQAKAVFSEAAPGTTPARHQFFVRGGQCSMAWFDEQAFYVSPAVPSLALSKGLAKKLAHEAPLAEPLVLLPQALGLLAEHFRGPTGKVTSLERAQAEAAVGGAAGLDALVEAEVLVVKDGKVEPAAPYAMALEAMWSECFLRIEASALSPAGVAATKVFTFVGPPRRRVLSEDLTVKDKTFSSLRCLSVDDATDLAGSLLG